MRILAASDIHLGRSPARTPAAWAEEFSPSVALDNLVTLAVDGKADAVLLGGDVADGDEAFFEAHGRLESALDRLRMAGIPLVAVAGNHDTRVLPELARAVDDADVFRLLGQGGVWESTDLTGRDGERVRVWGWSFPAQHCSDNPLDSFPGVGADAPPTVLGLLHADRDAAVGGPYASVRSDDFGRTGAALWILGHIHLPDFLPDDDSPGTISVYPGSLQALDPGEPGLHGALRIRCEKGRISLSRHRCGGLRYDSLELDASDLADRADAVQALRRHVDRLREEDPEVKALDLRLSILGESDIPPATMETWFEDWGDSAEDGALRIDDTGVHFERIETDVRPRLDLDDIARGDDLLARLSKILIDLEGPASQETTRAVLRAASDAVHVVDNATAFAGLPPRTGTDAETTARRLLRRQGYALLRTLIDQRENTHG